MQIRISAKTKKRLLALILAGAAAGFLNGLLGAGGGILLIYVFSAMNPDTSPAGTRDNFAATIACVIPITLFSVILYMADGRISPGEISPLALPAVLGGISGALLLDRVNTTFLKKFFACLVIYSGISMILR